MKTEKIINFFSVNSMDEEKRVTIINVDSFYWTSINHSIIEGCDE